MKKTKLLSAIILVMLVFASCSKIDDQAQTSNNDVRMKSTGTELCAPVTHTLYAGNPYGSYFTAGNVQISNDPDYLYIDVNSNWGFEQIPDNIAVGFGMSSPVADPDMTLLHYQYTVTTGTTTRIVIPLNEVYFEDLHCLSAIDCDTPFYFALRARVLLENNATITPEYAWVGCTYAIQHVICCIPVCQGETAWANGMRYTNKNWALYTSYTGMAQTVTLIAGQTKEAGVVKFTPNGNNVDIVIELNEGWSLQNVYEPVKVQGYDTAPTTKPAIGNFNTYKGEDISFTVPKYNFFGIHVDVQFCE